MIRRGEKPLALIKCSFEQSQEIINKQKNPSQLAASFHSEFRWRATTNQQVQYGGKQTQDYLPTISSVVFELELADFCAFEVDTYYFLN